MEAGDKGGGGGTAEGQGGPGNSGGPDGREGREGPRGAGAGEAGAAAAGSPQAAQALPAPGPSGQDASELGARAEPAAGAPGRQMLQFFLTVPFPTPIEAEMARQSMAPRVQLQGAVRKELLVSGNILAIRLSADDPAQLRISIASCLDQLSLLVHNMHRFVPPFFHKPKPGKGA